MLLLVGGAGVGKKTLLSHIVGGESAVATGKWDLDTKYYNATVDVSVCLGSYEDCSEDILKRAEAIVVVFDVNEAESFNVATTWAKIGEEHEPEVLLCIANKIDLISEDVWDLSADRYREWCISNGFELIECSSNKGIVGNGGLLGEDSTGVARVIEALHCTMWKNMKMKPRGAPAGVASPGDGGGSRLVEVSKPSIQPEEQANKKTNGSDGDKKRAEEKAQVLAKLEEAERRVRAGASSASGGNDEGAKDPLQQAMEKDVDDFAGILTQLRSARSHATTLPDQERKDFAAQMAMRLLKMMEAEDGMADGDDNSSISSTDLDNQ